MIIMGIDPGYARLGWGVIEKSSGIRSIAYGCIETSASMKHIDRLHYIHSELSALIEKHQPKEIAVEELFFAKNAKTAIKVGEARGVILLTASQKNIPTTEYKPLEVKQAITGYGGADKTQMQRMVASLLKLASIPTPDDTADALAVALTHAQTNQQLK